MSRTASLAGLAVASLCTSALTPVLADTHEATQICGPAGVLVERLSASYDADADAIVAEMELCEDASQTTRYRVHYALDVPGPGCGAGGDLMTLQFMGRTMGQGSSEASGNRLTFTLPVDLLSADLPRDGSTEVYLWGFAHFRGAPDRIPATDGCDGCDEPQDEEDVLTLTLGAPEEPSLLCGDDTSRCVFHTSQVYSADLVTEANDPSKLVSAATKVSKQAMRCVMRERPLLTCPGSTWRGSRPMPAAQAPASPRRPCPICGPMVPRSRPTGTILSPAQAMSASPLQCNEMSLAIFLARLPC